MLSLVNLSFKNVLYKKKEKKKRNAQYLPPSFSSPKLFENSSLLGTLYIAPPISIPLNRANTLRRITTK